MDSTVYVYNRHNEVPFLDSSAYRIDAHYFNIAQLARKRLERTLRLKIPKLSHLDLLVQEDAWIVVDRVLYDLPIAAWTNFHSLGRDNLHEPVECELRLYHFAARMVLKSSLKAMEDMLRQSLDERDHNQSQTVLAFTPKTNQAKAQ